MVNAHSASSKHIRTFPRNVVSLMGEQRRVACVGLGSREDAHDALTFDVSDGENQGAFTRDSWTSTSMSWIGDPGHQFGTTTPR